MVILHNTNFFFCGCGRTVIVPQIHFLLNITKLSISSTNHPMQFWLHSFTSFNSCCPTVVLIPFFPLSNSLKTSFFGAAPFSWECQKNILKMYIIHIFAKFRMHIVAWNFLTFLKAPTNTHRGFDDLKLYLPFLGTQNIFFPEHKFKRDSLYWTI